MRATTATRCCGLAVAFGLFLPIAIANGVQGDQSGPTVPGFRRAWQQRLDAAGAVEFVHLPTAIVVAGAQGQATALSLADGKELWKSSDAAVLGLATAGDLLVVGTELKIVAVNTRTWQPAWSATLEEPLAKLAGAASGVIAASASVVLHLAAADGRIVWTAPLAEPPSAKPVIDGGHVYVAFGRRLAAWDLATRAERWSVPFTDPIGVVVAAGSRLFATGAPRGFYAMNPRTGWVDWALKRAQIIGAAVMDDDRVYLASLDNTLLGLDRGRGARDWRAEIGGRAFAGPRLLNDVLVVPLTSGETVAVTRAAGTVTRAERAADATTPTLDTFDAFTSSLDGTMILAVTTNAAGERRVTALRRQ